MGSASSRDKNVMDEDDDSVTYPLQFNELLPSVANMLFIYESIEETYVEKLVDSLPGLPIVSDFSIILRNIKTTYTNEKNGRWSKNEVIYDQEKYDASLATANMVGKTQRVDGIVTILSTVVKDATTSEIKLQQSATDTSAAPLLTIQVTKDPNNDVYHNGVIMPDWTNLDKPKPSSCTEKQKGKLFKNDETALTYLRFVYRSFSINAIFPESSKYITVCSNTMWSTYCSHLLSIAGRQSVCAVYKLPGTYNLYTKSALNTFCKYYSSVYDRKYFFIDNTLVFGADSSRGGTSFQFSGKTIQVTNTENGNAQFTIDSGRIRAIPDSLVTGFIYPVNYMNEAKDTVTEVFDKVDLVPTDSSVFGLYVGSIITSYTSRNVAIEGHLIGCILNLRKNIDKLFIYYIDLTEQPATLAHIAKHSFLHYDVANKFLSNFPLESNQNIFDPKISYYSIGVGETQLNDNDLCIKGAAVRSLRDIKPSNNNLFRTFPKAAKPGYFIPIPRLSLTTEYTAEGQFVLLTAKDVSTTPLYNFIRLSTKLYKWNNWVYLFKTKESISAKGFTVGKLATQDYCYICPDEVTEYVKTASDDDNVRLVLNYGTTQRNIFLDPLTPELVTKYGNMSIGINEDSAPLPSYAMDDNSGIYTLNTNVYNIIQIRENVIGGPINSLAFSFFFAEENGPKIYDTAALTNDTMYTVTIIRDLGQSIAPTYIAFFDQYFLENANSLNYFLIMSMSTSNMAAVDSTLKGLKFGKFYTDTNTDRVIVYFPGGQLVYNKQLKTISRSKYGTLCMDSVKATSNNMETQPYKIFCEDFTKTYNSKYTLTESINSGPNGSFMTNRTAPFRYNANNIINFYIPSEAQFDTDITLFQDIKIRGGANYYLITYIRKSFNSLYLFFRALKKNNYFDDSKDKSNVGDYIFLIHLTDTDQSILFPSFMNTMKSLIPNCELRQSQDKQHYIMTSSKPVVEGNVFTVGKYTIGVDTKNSAIDICYDVVNSKWIADPEKSFVKYSSLAENSVITHPQVGVYDRNYHTTVNTIMTNITPLLSFVVLENVEIDEIEALDRMFTYMPEIKRVVFIIQNKKDLVINSTNVSQFRNFVFVYNSSILNWSQSNKAIVYTAANGKRESSDYVHIRFSSLETNAYMKFGIFSDPIPQEIQSNVISLLDFVINKSIGETYYGGIKIQINDRSTISNNAYKFSNLLFETTPVFAKFCNEVNKYLLFLRPVPPANLTLETHNDKFKIIAFCTIISSNNAPVNVFDIVTVMEQIKTINSPRLMGFFIYTKVPITYPPKEQTFTISNIVYNSSSLEKIEENVYTYGTAEFVQPYYYKYEDSLIFTPKHLAVGAVPLPKVKMVATVEDETFKVKQYNNVIDLTTLKEHTNTITNSFRMANLTYSIWSASSFYEHID